ncbi:MAG: uracil-DNA glycosylase [Anaerolineaceae bacterium]|jgi:uracil-DNA glycosylase family 4
MTRFDSLAHVQYEITFCRKCPRLVAYREEIARVKRRAYKDQSYWGKPVPGLGDSEVRLLVVGLAPGAHGSNRTGRMFTGDGSGNFLFPALYRAGFASQPDASQIGDGLTLSDLYITAVVHCAPPVNKPSPEEIRTCLPWLKAELKFLPKLQGIVALGKIGFDGLMSVPEFSAARRPGMRFGHNLLYELGNGLPWVLCSYHPSLQNTHTGRLTEEMFDEIWLRAKSRLV